MKSTSTLISDINYSKEKKVLTVELFTNPGVSYSFHDVPITVFENFINSNSRGKFFNKEIKKSFKMTKGQTIF